MTVTVTDPPSGSIVYYRKSASEAWTLLADNKYTSSLSADGSETIYFKVEARGYKPKGKDNTFGYTITRSTTDYGPWVYAEHHEDWSYVEWLVNTRYAGYKPDRVKIEYNAPTWGYASIYIRTGPTVYWSGQEI